MLGGNRARARNFLDLAQHAGFPLGALRYEIERPYQRERHGIVASEQERDDVVGHQFVRHALAGFRIRRAHQAAEQVVAVGGARATCPHQLAHGVAQSFLVGLHDPLAGPRQPMGQVEDGIGDAPIGGLVVARLPFADRLKQLRRAACQHRVGDHVEARAQHVAVDRVHGARRGLAPACDRVLGGVREDRAVAQELVVAEQRGGSAALPAPLPPLARDHRVAEHRLERIALERTLGKVGGAFEQQGLHRVGAGEEGDARRPRRDHHGLVIGLLRDDLEIVDEQLGDVDGKPERLHGWGDVGRIERELTKRCVHEMSLPIPTWSQRKAIGSPAARGRRGQV